MRALLCCALAAGCSSDPVNAAGNYTVAVTERDNGCNLSNWTVGMQLVGIPVTITQQGSSASANVMGAAGIALGLLLGGSTFSGSVDGDHLDLKLQGTIPHTTGNCTYTYNGEIAANLSGDMLAGQISYTAATNNNSDCASIQGCKSFEDFNGSRPPK